MTKKKKTEKKAAPKKKELKPYQKKEWLLINYPAKSAGQIAREQGVSRAAVLHQLRKHEIKITTRTSPKAGQRRDDVDRSYHKKSFLEKKLKAGLSIHKIATECNCSFMQVKHMVEKHGLTQLAKSMKQAKAVAVPKKKPAVKKAEIKVKPKAEDELKKKITKVDAAIDKVK